MGRRPESRSEAGAASRPRQPARWVLAGVALVLTAAGVLIWFVRSEVPTGHSQMVAFLQQIAAITPREHPYLGDSAARELRQQLTELSAVSSPRADLETLLDLHAQLGEEELRLDNLEEGIDHLATVYRQRKQLNTQGNVSPKLVAQAAYRLGIAYMRLGETQNCCQRNSLESCLLPIQGSGIHTQQDGSKQAISYFTEVLEELPKNSALHLKAKWLLNIMYMTVDGYPDKVPPQHLILPHVFESDERFPKFINMAPKLGLDTFDLLGGAIVDDFTGDEYLDIVVSTWDLNQQMHFFRNNQDGTFSDRTEEANLAGMVGGFNLVQADFDNDSDLDFLMLRGAWMGESGRIPNSLLRNNGDGTFTDVTFEAGLGEVHYPTQTAAWADYDNDGDLDLYIGNETLSRTQNHPCQLFQNNGDSTFTDVAEEAGVLNSGFTKGVTWGDYDDDGFADLYVSNLGNANRLFRNNRNGTFTDVAPQVGVTGPRMSFPVWFWDFNNDGVLDLFAPSYEWNNGNLAAVVASRLGLPVEYELPNLYQGDGAERFREVAKAQKLTQLILPMGANFGDLDNDGYLDFYIGTGYPDYEALMPNVMYRNQGGKGFSDVTSSGGFGHLQKGHAVVFADLDNDGDQDVFEQIGGFHLGDKFFNALFENPGFDNQWITIKLVGVQSNRSAIGARIRVDVLENGQRRSIYKHVNSGGSFGANPLRQTIGLGRAARIEMLQVHWPKTGLSQTFHNVSTDQSIQITEGEDEFKPLKLKPFKLGSTMLD